MRLQNKVAIVTGAGGGIGEAIAGLFATEGAVVYASDVRPVELQADRVLPRQLDVTDLDAWQALIDEVVDEHGAPDVLVNNAGLNSFGTIVDEPLDVWENVWRVNVTGTFFGMRAALPPMVERRAGSIINMSSTYAITATSGMAAYHASKGAVRSLTKNAAITYAESGVRVNSMHPGLTDTALTLKAPPERRQRTLDRTPLGRSAAPVEQAYGALYLASDESRFMTGSELIIDGGFVTL